MAYSINYSNGNRKVTKIRQGKISAATFVFAFAVCMIVLFLFANISISSILPGNDNVTYTAMINAMKAFQTHDSLTYAAEVFCRTVIFYDAVS